MERKPLASLDRNALKAMDWSPRVLKSTPTPIKIIRDTSKPQPRSEKLSKKLDIDEKRTMLASESTVEDCVESKKASIRSLLENQLEKVSFIESANADELRKVIDSLDRRNQEAKEYRKQLKESISLLVDVEEHRRDSESLRREAEDARKMKNILLKRIAAQADQLIKLDTEHRVARDSLADRDQQIHALEAFCDDLRVQAASAMSSQIPSKDDRQNDKRIEELSQKLLETEGMVDSLSQKLRQTEDKVRRMSQVVSAGEERELKAVTGGLIGAIVETVAEKIETEDSEQRLKALYEHAKSDLDALSEFVEIEREEFNLVLKETAEERDELSLRNETMEQNAMKSEAVSKTENRKLTKKLELLREEQDSDRKKMERLMQEYRVVRENFDAATEEREAAKATLAELRKQHGSAVENARREILSKKEDLEKEARSKDELNRNLREIESKYRRTESQLKDARATIRAMETEKGNQSDPEEKDKEIDSLKRRLAEMEIDNKRAEFKTKILQDEISTLTARAQIDEKQELERLKEEAEQYKTFARKYKEKMDSKFAEVTKKSEVAKAEVKKNWGLLAKHPDLAPLSRAILGMVDQVEQVNQSRSRRMSVM